MDSLRWDGWFRIAFIALFTSLTIVRSYFKVSAGLFRERPFSPSEGFWIVCARAVLGVPLLAATFLYIVQSDAAVWMTVSLPISLRASGIATGMVSLAILVWVQRALGKNFSTTIMVKRNHSLVRHGPYRIVRHPMYATYCLLFFSSFLVSGNWVIGVTSIAIIGILMTVRLRKEEALLFERFGEEYAVYERKTPRFLPLPTSGRQQELTSSRRAE